METLQVGGFFTLVASELDAKGNVLAGSDLVALTWTSSDPTVLSLAVHPGAQSCDVTAAGKVGTATVTASAGSVSSLPFSASVAVGPLASITLSVVAPVAPAVAKAE